MTRFYARSGSVRRRTAHAARVLVELVYPARCVHCRRPGQLLCDACVAGSVRLGNSVCRSCAQPLAITSICGACVFESPGLSNTVAVFQFGGAIRAAVHALKYEGTRAIAPVIAALVASDPRLPDLASDLVVPVPLHRRKLRARGYNQSELIAREIARRLSIRMNPAALRRVISSRPQARAKSRLERAAAVRGAFRADAGVSGRRILLVDDVATSGSTLKECARTLLQAGATRVDAVVVAREV